MQFIKNLQKMVQAQQSLEDTLYATVLNEVENGLVAKDLWAKSLAHGDFDPDKTKAYYIRERVSRLKKRSKDIGEYLRLVDQEAQFEDTESDDRKRYEEALEAHNQKLEALEAECQKLADRISAEMSKSNQRRRQGIGGDLIHTGDVKGKDQKVTKKPYAYGAFLAVLTVVAVLSGVNSVISIALGSMALLAVGAAQFSSQGQGESTNRLETEEPRSFIQQLRNQHQELAKRAAELRQNEPQPDMFSGMETVDVARKSELECELNSLFALKAID